MRAPWRGMGFLGAPALALLVSVAGSPAYAGDALLAPRLGAAAPGANCWEKPCPASWLWRPRMADLLRNQRPKLKLSRRKTRLPRRATPNPCRRTAAPRLENPGQVSAPALPPVNAALKAALEARSGLPGAAALPQRGEREAIAAFYALRDFAPLWFSGGTAIPAVAPAIERLKHAADDGLDVKGFPQAVSPATDEEIAAADLALSDAVVAYGRQASGSRVDPRMISRLIGVEPEVAGPAVISGACRDRRARRGRRIAPVQSAAKGLRGAARKTSPIAPGARLAGRDPAIPRGPGSAPRHARSARAPHSREAQPRRRTTAAAKI